MRTSLFAGLGTSAFATIALACTVSSPPAPDQNVGEFCADWAKAVCQLASGPCAFDATACTANQTTVCMSFIAAQQTGTRQYGQSNGQACIQALNGAYGGSPASISAATLAMVSTTCGKVVVGSQASDKPCTGDNDCASGLVCAPLLGQSGSVCAAVTMKNLGDICGDPGDLCQGDSYCASQAGAAPQCIATQMNGGACSATVPCGSSDRCASGTCQPRAAAEGSCATNADCTASAPYCDTYTPVRCTTGLSFAQGSYDCNGVLGASQASNPDSGAATAEGGPEASSGD
jgi:hypothetical protein